jgi:hypothetical protein
VARLRARGPDWLSRSPADVQDYLSWAEWMRGHAHDPSWRPHVIRHPATLGDMRWERWSRWRPGDARWRVRVIDTSALPVGRVVDELAAWVGEERALFRAGRHPLAGWADVE